jgi:membrane-associated phospholipid phosphatase
MRPLEAVQLLYMAVLALSTLLLWTRLAHPWATLGPLAAMAGVVLVMGWLAAREDRLPTIWRIVANFYPAVLLPLVFNALGPLIEALRGGPRDDLLIAADRAMFGVDVTVWAERFVTPLANDVFAVAYSTYYFLGLTLAALLWAFRREDGRRFFFTIVVAYYVSYTGYFFIPGLGPRATLADRQTVSVHTTPISKAIDDTLNRLEQTKYDVFPSGHTMIAMVVLIVAWKRLRRAFWFLLPFATGLIISTIYCRYHYAIDVIAGIVLAAITVPLSDRLYDWWNARWKAATQTGRSYIR